MAYLKKIANQGVETHRLILSEGAVTSTKRCTDAYNGLQDNLNPPSDEGYGMGASDAVLAKLTAAPRRAGPLGRTPGASAADAAARSVAALIGVPRGIRQLSRSG
jgi:hypothetical protein